MVEKNEAPVSGPERQGSGERHRPQEGSQAPETMLGQSALRERVSESPRVWQTSSPHRVTLQTELEVVSCSVLLSQSTQYTQARRKFHNTQQHLVGGTWGNEGRGLAAVA